MEDHFSLLADVEDKGYDTDSMTHLVFFIGQRPGPMPEVRLLTLQLDGMDVWPTQIQEIPGRQGAQASMGYWPAGRTLDFKWSFKTGDVRAGSCIIGVYRNSLRQRTVLLEELFEPYRSYSGEARIDTTMPRTSGSDPGVYIERTRIYNQCEAGRESVMLRNRSVKRYRVHVLKQGDRDETIPKALNPGESFWLGCTNDGYSYTISKLEALP